MNISSLKTVATRSLSRGVLVTKQFSPELLTGVGVVGVVAATFFIAKNTLKLEATIDKTRERIEDVKAEKHVAERTTQEDAVEVTKTYTKELTVAYVKGTGDIVKLYGPPVGLLVLSIGCIIGGHGILRKRNIALMTAYKTLETGFNAYRKRVVEEFGEEKDSDYYLGLRSEERVNPETGKTEIVKVQHADGQPSIYARYFDETSSGNWSPNTDNVLFFLRAVQAQSNDKLKRQGYLFLNDVLDTLGLERSSVGQLVGWTLSENGDNYIDFGIYDGSNVENRIFVNGGNAPAVLLDFNVDGPIWQRVDEINKF